MRRGAARRWLGRGLLALALLNTGAAGAAGVGEASCDYGGFEQPCKVSSGTYRMLAPQGKGPFPVLVYLYGSGGHSVTVTSHPLFQSTIVERGYLLIVPAALDMTYARGVRDSGWSLRNEPRQARNEIAFLRQVLQDAARRFPIDRDRILIAGQSRGAFLTWEIACHAPELGSAFAAHAGGYLGDLPQRCQRPVRLLDTHGLSDTVVPMTRRDTFSGGAALPGLEESLSLMSRTNGCTADGLDTEAADFFRFDRHSWTGCQPGSSLDLMLHPGGHAMPWIWFRAILDWFEETPAAAPVSKPVTRVLGGDRPEGVFKRPPARTAAE